MVTQFLWHSVCMHCIWVHTHTHTHTDFLLVDLIKDLRFLISQIQSLEIETPRIKQELILQVIDGLESYKELRQLTITNPAAFRRLPNYITLRCVRLLNLPQYCDDWKWLQANRVLEEIEVSFRKTAAETSSEESMRVCGREATFSSMTPAGTLPILRSLPKKIAKKVLPVRSVLNVTSHVFSYLKRFLNSWLPHT